MIEINDVYKNFGKLEVLKDVNLKINIEECVALIGPNGCGKTTLIKSVLGMVLPSSGNIIVDGIPIADDYSYRANIGFMPQIGRYPDNMTIGQIFNMIKEIRREKVELDEDLVEQFELKKLYNKPMRTLSGGTTQKVSAALAFLFNPRFLILDEPTAGLDPLSAEILKEKIQKENRKGKLVLITSHLLSELDDLVSHIVFMQDGLIRFHKTIDDLKRSTGESKISKAITHVLRNSKS